MQPREVAAVLDAPSIPDLDLSGVRPRVHAEPLELEPAFEPRPSNPAEPPAAAAVATEPPARDHTLDFDPPRDEAPLDLALPKTDALDFDMTDQAPLELEGSIGAPLDLMESTDAVEPSPPEALGFDGALEPPPSASAKAPLSAPPSGEEAWKSAASSSVAFAPPPPPSLATPRPFTPPAVKIAYRSSVWSSIPQLLFWLAILCFVLSALMIGVSYLFKRVAKLEIAELKSIDSATNIEILDGVANWSQAITIDLASPVLLAGAEELSRRRTELRGRLVSLPAVPAATFLHKQYRIDRNGQREEIPGVSRVYCPVWLGNSYWVVSQPIQNASFTHPDVKRFEELGTYTGVVQRLDQLVSLEMIRQSEVTDESPSLQGKIDVPDDALAIVTVPPMTEQKKYTVATIAGTQGRYLAVTVDDQPSSDQSLTGRFHPCPSKTCEDFALALGTEPAGVLSVKKAEADNSQKIQIGIILFFAFACLAGSFYAKRRLE